MDEMSTALDQVEYRLFETLIILLDYNNSWQFYQVRRLQAIDDDILSETATEQLMALEELFLDLDSARDYLKTLWVQRELAELSRMILYTGIPAILLATAGIFAYRNVPQAGMGLPRPVIVAFIGSWLPSHSCRYRSSARISDVSRWLLSALPRSVRLFPKTNTSKSVSRSRLKCTTRMTERLPLVAQQPRKLPYL